MKRQSDPSSMVRLNIGGKKFCTTIDTLTCREPDSMLSAMFSGHHTVLRDPDKGYVFVDRDGEHFRHILNWLRDGIVPILTESQYAELRQEAEYYQLLGLIEGIHAVLSRKKEEEESESELKRTDIIRCIKSEKVRFRELNLSGIDLSKLGADLSNVNLEGANIERANLKGADLSNANLDRANLEGANLKGADLSNANLEGAKLERAILKGAFLSNANLEGANLEEANLKGAHLGNANLEGANLERANLKGADLRNANLEGANLEGVSLKGADLSIANLEGANLKGANLKRAQTKALGVLNAVGLSNTVLKLMERRHRVDNWIKYAGMIFTVIILFLFWRWKI